jgi:hypothetical protein
VGASAGALRGARSTRVGLDTFRPVAADTLEDHPMHSRPTASSRARGAILAAGGGRRVVCIGTVGARRRTVADPPPDGADVTLIAPGYPSAPSARS